MVRSKWKGVSVNTKRVLKGKMCWARNRKILGMDVGNTIGVYNGQKFVNVLVEDGMVGKAYGTYVIKRVMGVGINDKKKKKKRKSK